MRCHKKGFTIRKKSTMIENHKSQAVQESVEEKSRMQEVPRESRPQECGAESGLAEWIAKTVSERPLIGHGSPRYRQRKVADGRCQQQGWNRVQKMYVPCNRNIAGDFLCELKMHFVLCSLIRTVRIMQVCSWVL